MSMSATKIHVYMEEYAPISLADIAAVALKGGLERTVK